MRADVHIEAKKRCIACVLTYILKQKNMLCAAQMLHFLRDILRSVSQWH